MYLSNECARKKRSFSRERSGAAVAEALAALRRLGLEQQGVLQASARICRKQQLVVDLFAQHLLPILAQGYNI